MNRNKYEFHLIERGKVRCYSDKNQVVRQAVRDFGKRWGRTFSTKHFKGRTWVIRVE